MHPRFADSTENCTWHNFNTVPTKGGNFLVSGNYQAGINVIDFTKPAAPKVDRLRRPEAAAVTTTYGGDGYPDGGDWSTYWYNGKIYEADIYRGLIVWDLDNAFTDRANTVAYSNPQTQIGSIAADNVAPTVTSTNEGAGYLQGSARPGRVQLRRRGPRRRVVHEPDDRRRHVEDRLPLVHGHGRGQGRQHDDQDRRLRGQQHRRRPRAGRHGRRHAVADAWARRPRSARSRRASRRSTRPPRRPTSSPPRVTRRCRWPTRAGQHRATWSTATFALPQPLQGLGVGQDLHRPGLQRPAHDHVQAGDRRQRRAAHGHVQQDADVHPVDDDAVIAPRSGAPPRASGAHGFTRRGAPRPP